jgi:hypothetical protein
VAYLVVLAQHPRRYTEENNENLGHDTCELGHLKPVISKIYTRLFMVIVVIIPNIS